MPRHAPEDPEGPRWVSPSELAEYTFCPRAWWYRTHPEEYPRTASLGNPAPQYARGVKVHRTLAHRHRAERRGAPWAYLLVALGSLLALLWILGVRP
jgi:hypothetical protein